MAFGDYVRVLRTYWRSILAVTVLGAAVGAGITFVLTPQYTATASVLFTPNGEDTGGQDRAYSATYVQGRMVNYADLVRSDAVLAPVVDLSDLDLEQTPKQLADKVSAEFAPTATVLDINVEDSSKSQATAIAKAVAQSLITQVARFEQITPDVEDGVVEAPRSAVTGSLIVDPVEPDSASSPKLQLWLAAGTMLGLVLALAIALLRSYLATRKGTTAAATGEPEPQRSQPLPPASAYTPVPAALEPTTEARIESPQRSGRRTRR